MILADPDATLSMLQACARHQHPEAFGGAEIPAPPEVERISSFEPLPEGCNREGTVWEEQGMGHPEARGITATESAVASPVGEVAA